MEGFASPKLALRQYMTPPSIASELLWTAYMNGDIDRRDVYDLGTGTGMLAIGAALLGASVTGFDIDRDAIKIAIRNASRLKANITIIEKDIEDVEGYCDTVIMNPPFMVKGGKNDKIFLEKAFSLSDRVYSIHTAHTREWIRSFVESKGFNSMLIGSRDFPLPKQFAHQLKPLVRQRIDLWYFFK